MNRSPRLARLVPVGLAALLAVVLVLPAVVLAINASRVEVIQAVRSDAVAAALGLSLRTSLAATLLVALLGTPLAWWLARGTHRVRGAITLVAEVPLVLPPAVIGLALLLALSPNSPLGSALASVGVRVPFTTAAVILAQVVVAAPFFVLAASSAFRALDGDMLLTARALGASPWRCFATLAIPLSLPGLLDGLAMTWARALGEFGATLLLAGNLPGATQTMPVAIYASLERSVVEASAVATVLAASALGVLVAARILRRALVRRLGLVDGGVRP